MSHWNSRGVRRLDQLLLIRFGLHAVWCHRLLAATAVGAVSTMAGTALADSADVSISEVIAPSIVVESYASTYSRVSSPAIPIEGNLRVTIDAQVSGRVKSWIAWPRLVLEDGGTQGFLARGDSRNYSRPRPKSVDRTKRFAITKSDYEATMVMACAEHADVLRGQGLSDTQIFGQDRQVEMALEGRLEYETSGFAGAPPPPEVPARPLTPLTVNCEGHEPVVSSDLEIVEQSSFGGACRLRFDGRIVTTRPNEDVSFRYADEAGNQSGVITVRTNGGKVATFSNTDKLPSGSNRGRIRIVGVSSTFKTAWQDYDLDCNQPTGITSEMPQTPGALVRFGAILREEMHRGYLCPVRVAVVGTVVGRGQPASGHAAIFIDDRYQMRSDYNIVGDETVFFVHQDVLTWREGRLGRGNQKAPQAPTQTLEARIKVFSSGGELLDEGSVRRAFVCREGTAVAGVGTGAGGLADLPGNAATQSQQTIGGLATVQSGGGANAQMSRPGAVPAFAVQSPQGRVRKGEIRLSGGKANARYMLRFYRKTDGSYKRVKTAQLPKRMTGKRANFDLAALDGSRAWRLQVCPVGTTGISSTQNCKTSDFRLPRIGVKKPAGEAPVKGGKFKLLAPKKVN